MDSSSSTNRIDSLPGGHGRTPPLFSCPGLRRQGGGLGRSTHYTTVWGQNRTEFPRQAFWNSPPPKRDPDERTCLLSRTSAACVRGQARSYLGSGRAGQPCFEADTAHYQTLFQHNILESRIIKKITIIITNEPTGCCIANILLLTVIVIELYYY
jgi:hypothetical protein